MISPTNTVVLSRVLVALLGIVVWFLVYSDARFAYRMPRGTKRLAYQISTVVAAVMIVVLQIHLMDSLAPADAYGSYFFGFVMVEAGGGLVLLFTTLVRERSRSMKLTSDASSAAERKE